MDSNDKKLIGQKIKKFREIRGFTREELAKHIGLSTFAIVKYEQGQRTPDLQILNKIASDLDVPSGYLLGLEEYQNLIDIHVDKIFEYQDKMNDPTLSKKERAKNEKLRNDEIMAKRAIEDEATNQIRSNKIVEDIKISLNKLTLTGQKEAAKRVEELTHIKEYTI